MVTCFVADSVRCLQLWPSSQSRNWSGLGLVMQTGAPFEVSAPALLQPGISTDTPGGVSLKMDQGTRSSASTTTGPGPLVNAAPVNLASCAFCGSTSSYEASSMMRCSVCLSVAYCTKDHQHAHWPDHRKSCEKLRQERERSYDLLKYQAGFIGKQLKLLKTKLRRSVEPDGTVTTVSLGHHLNVDPCICQVLRAIVSCPLIRVTGAVVNRLRQFSFCYRFGTDRVLSSTPTTSQELSFS